MKRQMSMKAVGLRELKNRLSEYVREVRSFTKVQGTPFGPAEILEQIVEMTDEVQK